MVRLSEIALAARHRLAPLTAEVAGYIVWLVTAEALTVSRSVSAERIGVTTAGEVMLAAGEPEPAIESERELRRLLGSLLALCQASTPALKKASERTAKGDLEALQGELGAALIPINHAASRRALARLYRETDRARAELAVPVVIVEDAPEALAEGGQTPPSRAPSADPLELGWQTPMASVLQRCDTERAEPRGLDVELSDVALVFEAEIRSSDAGDAEPPPSVEVAARPKPLEAAAETLLEPELALFHTVRTTLRSAVAAELVESEPLEIDVQFARDTERPAPGWPSEWSSRTPSPSIAEAVPTLPSAGAELVWEDHDLDAFLSDEAPAESHRRTQLGLAPVTRPAAVAAPELSERARRSQTLRVTEPVASGVADRHRSDLGQLLSRFLSESGSDERITKDLRRMMGLELEAERLSEDAPPRAVGS